MNRSQLPLICAALVLLVFGPWWDLSGDDTVDVTAYEQVEADAEDTAEELRELLERALAQLEGEVEARQEEYLTFRREHAFQYLDADRSAARNFELQGKLDELNLELALIDSQEVLARSQQESQQAVRSQVESLRGEAVDLARKRVELLEDKVERTRSLLEDGATEFTALAEVETQLLTAAIELVEHRIALAEIPLQYPSNELEQISVAKEALLSQIEYIHGEQQRHTESQVFSLESDNLRSGIERALQLQSAVEHQLRVLDSD